MKGILGKNKWIAVLLCITMLLCISPLSPLVAFGEDGDAGVSDSVEGDAGDVSTEDGSMDGDTTGDNGQSPCLPNNVAIVLFYLETTL